MSSPGARFSIERLRTLVLVAGVLLVAALGLFLARGRLKGALNLAELPPKLGINITQDATGFTLDHSMGGHSRYRIHASKVAQYKNNHAILHDVKIELFGEDGSRVDRIEGAEFDYDQTQGTALAAGAVEITLTRPAVAPAVAPKASAAAVTRSKAATPIASAAATAERGEIHVKTSGLRFDTHSGVAQTAQRVDFSMVQGGGSSMGATYDSKGLLVLDKAVELNTDRRGEKVLIHAAHAEFERSALLCRMHTATADYRGGEATAGDATVLFRKDGSAQRLNASNGFNMTTATGSHITAPTGSMDFDERNQPERGDLQGGVTMDSTRAANDGASLRRMRGTAPTAKLDFDKSGALRHVHLERGVKMQSETLSEARNGQAGNTPLRVSRTWTSPIADVDFRDDGKGQAEPAALHGVQGVVVTGESQRGKGPVVPSRLAADQVSATFGADSALQDMVGEGHASLEETSASGTRQTSSGDRLRAHFLPGGGKSVASAATSRAPVPAPVSASVSAPVSVSGQATAAAGTDGPGFGAAGQIQSAVLDGHVVLTQQEPAKSGSAAARSAAAPAPLHAWAGHAEYEGVGEWLRLTVSPRVEDGGLQMTADTIDVSHQSGDAFAHGNVKASWFGGNGASAGASGAASPGHGDVALGGQGPAHVIAAEAELEQATGIATFKGHARLWQQANSVAAPVIVLDRLKQTLTAHSADPVEPVKLVLLSTGGMEPGPARPSGTPAADSADNKADSSKAAAPTVIRVRSGDLKYSDAERKAWVRGGALGTVTAETASATSVSDAAELVLLPERAWASKGSAQSQPGRPQPSQPQQSQPQQGQSQPGQSQVDRLTAHGHVVVTSGSRRGTGEQLVYTGEDGKYVLTGTAAAPPRMTDPTRGNVTGAALVFFSRDDSITVAGDGGRTTTQTTTQK